MNSWIVPRQRLAGNQTEWTLQCERSATLSYSATRAQVVVMREPEDHSPVNLLHSLGYAYVQDQLL